jgi:hypothetical protein
MTPSVSGGALGAGPRRAGRIVQVSIGPPYPPLAREMARLFAEGAPLEEIACPDPRRHPRVTRADQVRTGVGRPFRRTVTDDRVQAVGQRLGSERGRDARELHTGAMKVDVVRPAGRTTRTSRRSIGRSR